MSLIDTITPKYIKDLVPYSSAKRELFNQEVASNALWLNANESPYDLGENRFNRYPDFQSDNLIEAYATYAGVSAEQVLASRGADEAIELLVRTFCLPGEDSIVINPPTYGMYKICADTFNVNTIKVELNSDYQLDVDAIIAQKQSAQVKLVFICSPNNPTGGLMARDSIIAVLEAYKNSALVVLDEAYIEFCPEGTVTDLLSQYENLVVLRTLSKAFALAGIRCGFTLASKAIIDMMKKVIAPYPIPAPVEQLAVNALSKQGIDNMRSQVATLNEQKQALTDALETIDCVERQLSSDTNFVLAKLKGKTQVLETMKANGIYLRDQSAQPGLEDNIRITIGTAEQMAAVLDILKGQSA